MKKKLMIMVLALVLVALLAVMLAACNPSDNTTDDGGIRDFERGKYTVTFKTDSDMVLSNPTITDIPYGTKIEEPKNAEGEIIKPVKKGYDFEGWSIDGKNLFQFDSTPITSSITLTAKYKARTFTHTAVLEAKIEYIAETDTYELYKNARPEGEIGLQVGAQLETTYDQLTSLPSPTSSNGAKFCFWYYMQDGKPVQLTRWREEDKADVDLLTKFALTQELEIYPMFDDNLPLVTVKYHDTVSPGTYNQFDQTVPFGENLKDKPDPTDYQHGEYSFDYWYYLVDDVDSEGNSISTENIFVYEDGTEKNPTSPMDAAGAENNFKPVTLHLYAKWTKEIKINSIDDYMEIYDKLRISDPTDDEKKEIERILSANITITADLKFGNRTLEPLFDSEHIFIGSIDGGTYNSSNVVTDRIAISGGLFGNKTDASVFGYSDGYIANIVFSNVGLAVTDSDGERKTDGKYADTVYYGTVTTQNRGTVHNCEVTHALQSDIKLDGLHTVVFGGITAVNRIKDKTSGALTSCTVTMTSFSANCEALTFGGLAGMSNPTARLSKCIADITVLGITCTDDGIASNGRSSLIMGGLVGNNSGYIALSIVRRFDVSNVESLTDFSFGGVAGVNTGSIRTTHAASVLGSEANPANVSGSLSQTVSIGGLAGRNEGYFINSYCDIEAYARISSAPQFGCLVAVGGIVGNNYSNKKDTSSAATSGICAINSCYSTGKISVKVAESLTNVTVYAGGIAGRNTHSKLSSIFTAVNISVVNDGGGNNNLGYMFGAMENNSTVKSNCYYIDENKLFLNGVEYIRTVGDGEDAEDVETFPMNKIGTALLKSAFGDEKIFTTLGFSNTDKTWTLSPDSVYPVFDSSIYQ